MGDRQLNITVMVPVAKADSDIEGTLISCPSQGTAIVGSFSLGTDEVMTFTHPQGEHHVSERIWYASENLRLRSTTLSDADGPSEANFCSEIRRMGGDTAETNCGRFGPRFTIGGLASTSC